MRSKHCAQAQATAQIASSGTAGKPLNNTQPCSDTGALRTHSSFPKVSTWRVAGCRASALG